MTLQRERRGYPASQSVNLLDDFADATPTTVDAVLKKVILIYGAVGTGTNILLTDGDDNTIISLPVISAEPGIVLLSFEPNIIFPGGIKVVDADAAVYDANGALSLTLVWE